MVCCERKVGFRKEDFELNIIVRLCLCVFLDNNGGQDDVPTFFQEKLKELGCFAPSYHSSFQLDVFFPFLFFS